MLKVSAPGKVILFGDHSVVYGRQAIAAALSLRTTLQFTRGPVLRLSFPDVGLDEEISLSKLVLRGGQVEPNAELDVELQREIDQALTGLELPDVARAAAAAFIYLFCQVVTEQHLPDCIGVYRITSDLPIGAGLGSSASVSVIIATTLLILVGRIERPDESIKDEVKIQTLALINRWAYVGEQVIHGTPSGVDNTVATYGRGLAFRRGTAHRTIAMPILPLLLTDTGVPRSTKTQVANVALRREAIPTVVEPILDAMHAVAVEAEGLLSNNTREVSTAELGRLVDMNQCLLGSLGVSHPAIEAVVAQYKGVGYSKLVGAGGGGCVITLLGEQVASLDESHSSTSEQQRTYDVTLGGPGVGVHEVSKDSNDEVVRHWN